jgi:hypothetical protein
MANTERLAALVKVRLARNTIQDTLANPNIVASDRDSLQSLVFALNDLEDTLILDDLTESVDAIREDSDRLSKVVAAMRAAGTQMAQEAAIVDTAAKAVGGLAQLVSVAVAHGLVP